MTGVFIKRARKRDLEMHSYIHREEGHVTDDRGRDRSDAAVSQGTSIVSHHQKLGRSQEGFFPRDFREGVHLDFGLLASKTEKTNFCCLRPSSLSVCSIIIAAGFPVLPQLTSAGVAMSQGAPHPPAWSLGRDGCNICGSLSIWHPCISRLGVPNAWQSQ